MNITTPLPQTQLNLSLDMQSLIAEVTSEQPAWIHTLIEQTVENSVLPMPESQLRELVKYLCPAQVPEHTPQVEWASRRIMTERLGSFTTARRAKIHGTHLDSARLRQVGTSMRWVTKRTRRDKKQFRLIPWTWRVFGFSRTR